MPGNYRNGVIGRKKNGKDKARVARGNQLPVPKYHADGSEGVEHVP